MPSKVSSIDREGAMAVRSSDNLVMEWMAWIPQDCDPVKSGTTSLSN